MNCSRLIILFAIICSSVMLNGCVIAPCALGMVSQCINAGESQRQRNSQDPKQSEPIPPKPEAIQEERGQPPENDNASKDGKVWVWVSGRWSYSGEKWIWLNGKWDHRFLFPPRTKQEQMGQPPNDGKDWVWVPGVWIWSAVQSQWNWRNGDWTRRETISPLNRASD